MSKSGYSAQDGDLYVWGATKLDAGYLVQDVDPRNLEPQPRLRPHAGLSLVQNQIVVPLDFSDRSDRVIEHAVALAKEMRARLHMIHVVEGVRSPGAPTTFKRYEDAANALERRVSTVRGSADVDGQVLLGNPAPVIRKFADRLPADLIVMGARGREYEPDALVGTVARQTLLCAPCPVVAVRAPL